MLISPDVLSEGLSEFPPLFAPFSLQLTLVLTVLGNLLCLTFLLSPQTDMWGGPTSMVYSLSTTVSCRQKSKVCWEPLCPVPAEAALSEVQRTVTVKLVVRRQLRCQTSLIISSVITDVFKHLRFKQLYTTSIHTYGVHHTAEHNSVVFRCSSKLASTATQPKWCSRESLAPWCRGAGLMLLWDMK